MFLNNSSFPLQNSVIVPIGSDFSNRLGHASEKNEEKGGGVSLKLVKVDEPRNHSIEIKIS